MAFGKNKEPKEPKAPKEKKPKKEKPPKNEKPAKKEKPPTKGKDPKKPKKGQEAPQEGEELEEGKKKPPIILLLIPVAVIAIAAVVFFVFIFPNLGGGPDDPDDPGTIETPEPLPPELPEQLMVGKSEMFVPGMTLEADESGAASAVIARAVTYTYTNLNDAGAAVETYMSQLRAASPGFSVVDEDFVRTSELPEFTAAEGMVLLARNLSKDELKTEFGIEEVEEVEPPEPTDPPEEESDEPEAVAVMGGIALIAKNLSAPGTEEPPTPTDPPEDGNGDPEGADPAPTESPEPEEPVEKVPSYVIAVRITWSEGRCVVVIEEVEGEVTSPPPSRPGSTPSVGVRDAEAQLLSMTPEELGLPGTSMSQYEVIPENWTEMVNGITCIRLNVYYGSDSPTPNMIAGSYLMSVDGAHLYKKDPVTDELQELDFTLNVG